ncbi:MAG: hypothetical protein C7B43_12620 [Sulfobacillus benefaciens]|uniref:Uncharacterized protein n=1 Tax=Sulfobacillus benefaciens TaxID=453960 RepID=A0A2T2WXR5_9FIRM|nr:MAG: hypothetical protein C7B43_12620 [Sulfobacillus benefaciens]
MQSQGMRFSLPLRRQFYVVDGYTKFSGGLIVESVGGGTGLADRWYKLAESQGVDAERSPQFLVMAKALLLRQSLFAPHGCCDRGDRPRRVSDLPYRPAVYRVEHVRFCAV